jgi:chromosome segregation ATPase
MVRLAYTEARIYVAENEYELLDVAHKKTLADLEVLKAQVVDLTAERTTLIKESRFQEDRIDELMQDSWEHSTTEAKLRTAEQRVKELEGLRSMIADMDDRVRKVQSSNDSIRTRFEEIMDTSSWGSCNW